MNTNEKVVKVLQIGSADVAAIVYAAELTVSEVLGSLPCLLEAGIIERFVVRGSVQFRFVVAS